MFGLFRTLILVLVAFVAGVFFERNGQREACAAAGGTWQNAGYCGALN